MSKTQLKMPQQPAPKPTKPVKDVELTIDTIDFHLRSDGHNIPIKRFTWKNKQRIQIQVITYGATITSIKYPNKKGMVDDIVLGYDGVAGYMENRNQIFGTVGRCTNIIKDGKFSIGKTDYKVCQNYGEDHYDGGYNGFHKMIWDWNVNGNKVVLSLLSPDGNEGFPGDLIVFAIYELTALNEFTIEYKAVSTKPTILNMSNNTYFNLGGHETGPCEMKGHQFLFNCDCYSVTDCDMTPTGEIKSVQNTIFDFQVPVKMNDLLEKLDGYNINLCVNKGVCQTFGFIARITHKLSGRILEIYSNQPGVQFETANKFPFPLEHDPLTPRVSIYLKNDIVTFDLLDEILLNVIEISNIDKAVDYEELINVIRDLQRKSKQVHRKSTGFESSSHLSSSIKHVSSSLESINSVNITSVQRTLVGKILEHVNKLPTPNMLGCLKSKLESAVQYASSLNELGESRTSPLEDVLQGKRGAKYWRHGAFCVKTQNYPDAINHSNFPDPVLKPNEVYQHVIVYKFWTRSDQVGVSGFL